MVYFFLCSKVINLLVYLRKFTYAYTVSYPKISRYFRIFDWYGVFGILLMLGIIISIVKIVGRVSGKYSPSESLRERRTKIESVEKIEKAEGYEIDQFKKVEKVVRQTEKGLKEETNKCKKIEKEVKDAEKVAKKEELKFMDILRNIDNIDKYIRREIIKYISKNRTISPPRGYIFIIRERVKYLEYTGDLKQKIIDRYCGHILKKLKKLKEEYENLKKDIEISLDMSTIYIHVIEEIARDITEFRSDFKSIYLQKILSDEKALKRILALILGEEKDESLKTLDKDAWRTLENLFKKNQEQIYNLVKTCLMQIERGWQNLTLKILAEDASETERSIYNILKTDQQLVTYIENETREIINEISNILATLDKKIREIENKLKNGEVVKGYLLTSFVVSL